MFSLTNASVKLYKILTVSYGETTEDLLFDLLSSEFRRRIRRTLVQQAQQDSKITHSFIVK